MLQGVTGTRDNGHSVLLAPTSGTPRKLLDCHKGALEPSAAHKNPPTQTLPPARAPVLPLYTEDDESHLFLDDRQFIELRCGWFSVS